MGYLTVSPHEEGTLVISMTFNDESKALVTPKTLTWTLTDEAGAVINSREDVAVTSLDTTVHVALTGDDLAIIAGVGLLRIFTIKGTYDSTYGVGLALRDVVKFNIIDLKAV